MKLYVLFFSLVSPFWSFIVNIKRQFTNNVSYVAFILLGLQINYCNKFSDYSDISRYIGNYKAYLDKMGTIDYLNDLYYVLTLDIFSSFGLNPICIYTFWSIVFYTGVFLCAREIRKYVLNDSVYVLLFVTSVLSINFWEFSIMRFYTGAVYLIYIFIKLLPLKISYKFAWLLIAPFFHFTLLLPIVGFIIIKIFPNKTHIFFVLSITTIIIQFFPAGYLDGVISINENYDYYLSQKRNLDIYAGSNIGRFFYVPLCAFYLFCLWRIHNKFSNYYKKDKNVLNFGLMSIILFNVVSVSAEFITRYKHMFIVITVYCILYYWHKSQYRPQRYLNLMIPIMFILFQFDVFLMFDKLFNIITLMVYPFLSSITECLENISKTSVWI